MKNIIIKFFTDSSFRFFVIHKYGLDRWISDKKFIKIMFKHKMGTDLDLLKPVTFNEKLQWLKLYYRDDLFSKMVDKYEAKKIAAKLIGSEHIIKTYGIWNSFDEIDFDALPKQFVLKTTHDCGGVVICKDKASFDKKSANLLLTKHLKRKYFYNCREWPYKNIHPRILAEEYMQDIEFDTLPVYKIFNFSGEPILIQVIQNDKKKDESIDYFNTKWEKQSIKQNFPNSTTPISQPDCLDEMLEISKKLSMNLPFIRTDLYVVKGYVYFSEFTFYSDAGFEKFYPNEWDYKLGDLIILPKIKVI